MKAIKPGERRTNRIDMKIDFEGITIYKGKLFGLQQAEETFEFIRRKLK
jgi:hypothetical protein